MKIKIEITNKELLGLIQSSEGMVKIEEKPKTVKGNFGIIKYDTNSIEFDLKESFTLATINLASCFKNTVLSFVGTVKMFFNSWCEDVEIIEEETEEKPKEEEQ